MSAPLSNCLLYTFNEELNNFFHDKFLALCRLSFFGGSSGAERGGRRVPAVNNLLIGRKVPAVNNLLIGWKVPAVNIHRANIFLGKATKFQSQNYNGFSF